MNYIEEINEWINNNSWTSVKKQTPLTNGQYFVLTNRSGNDVYDAEYRNGNWYGYDRVYGDVLLPCDMITHWMSRQEPQEQI